MEPVTPIAVPTPTKLSADAAAEYGPEPISKKVMKYLGYALLLLFLLAFICWPFFIGMK
jgi:hypothetical protein